MQVKLNIKKTEDLQGGCLEGWQGLQGSDRGKGGWKTGLKTDKRRDRNINDRRKSQGENLDIYFKQCCNKKFSEFINTLPFRSHLGCKILLQYCMWTWKSLFKRQGNKVILVFYYNNFPEFDFGCNKQVSTLYHKKNYSKLLLEFTM